MVTYPIDRCNQVLDRTGNQGPLAYVPRLFDALFSECVVLWHMCAPCLMHLCKCVVLWQVEEKTPFARWFEPGMRPLPTDEEASDMFCMASAKLGAAGYEHYEVSNYAKPGHR